MLTSDHVNLGNVIVATVDTFHFRSNRDLVLARSDLSNESILIEKHGQQMPQRLRPLLLLGHLVHDCTRGAHTMRA